MSGKLNISVRIPGGKKEARRLRYEGKIPGVIYGSGMPVSVSVDAKALEQVCYSSAFFSHVIEVKLDGKTEHILPREIDYNPVTDRPIHIDFQRISQDSKIKIHVAIEFIDEEKSPGMKKGGVLNTVVHQLECLCPASDIPEKFVLSLAGKEIGDSLLLTDIVLPTGVEPVNAERDSVIATLVSSRTSADDDSESEETTEEETAATE